MTQPPQLVASVEVCAKVGIDRSTLSRWIKDGSAVPTMRLPGKTGAYLFTPAEVARLVTAYKRVEPQEQSA